MVKDFGYLPSDFRQENSIGGQKMPLLTTERFRFSSVTETPTKRNSLKIGGL